MKNDSVAAIVEKIYQSSRDLLVTGEFFPVQLEVFKVE
jgi:hypothetical protein